MSTKQTANQNAKQTTSGKSKKQEPVAEVDEVEVEEELAEEVEVDDEEEQLDDAAEEEEEEAVAPKKSKKVEFVCESLEDALTELLRVDSELEQQAKYRKAVFKTYQKLIAKQLRQSKNRRTRTSDTPKEATGFVKAIPVPKKFVDFYNEHLVSDADFKKIFTSFNPSNDTPRTEITKMIYHYIRTNNLYVLKEDGTHDKRCISPDEALVELFDVDDGETIGFNNFQSYVTRLYGSSTVVADEDASDAEEEAVIEAVSKSKGSKAKVAAK
jgi:hypothetical protein